MSMYTLREVQASVGADTCNKICIWDSLMDSESLRLTGNTSTMYAVGFLDLQKDGPSVIDLPPGMLGILDDMEFHHMSDLGVAGPDKGKGGKFLVLRRGLLCCRGKLNDRLTDTFHSRHSASIDPPLLKPDFQCGQFCVEQHLKLFRQVYLDRVFHTSFRRPSNGRNHNGG